MQDKHFWLIWSGGWSLTMPFILGLAWWFEQDFTNFKATALPAEAVVVGHHDQTRTTERNRTETTGWDDYEYIAPAGQTVPFSIINTGSQPRQQVGHRQAILYQPSDLARVRLNDGSIGRVASWIRLCSPIGVLIGLTVWFLFRKRVRDSRAT